MLDLKGGPVAGARVVALASGLQPAGLAYTDADGAFEIDGLPPGRLPVATRVVPEPRRASAIGDLRRDLEAGRRAYVVYPLVEASEALDLRSATAGFEALPACDTAPH